MYSPPKLVLQSTGYVSVIACYKYDLLSCSTLSKNIYSLTFSIRTFSSSLCCFRPVFLTHSPAFCLFTLQLRQSPPLLGYIPALAIPVWGLGWWPFPPSFLTLCLSTLPLFLLCSYHTISFFFLLNSDKFCSSYIGSLLSLLLQHSLLSPMMFIIYSFITRPGSLNPNAVC